MVFSASLCPILCPGSFNICGFPGLLASRWIQPREGTWRRAKLPEKTGCLFLTVLAVPLLLHAYTSPWLSFCHRSSPGWTLRNTAPSLVPSAQGGPGFQLLQICGVSLSLLGVLNFTFTSVYRLCNSLHFKQFEDHLFPAGSFN